MSMFAGRPVKISGTGVYIPEKIMTNADFEKIIDTTDSWILDRTGIKKRHFAAEDEKCSDLAYKAALDALNDSGLSALDLDMVIVSTNSPDSVFPAMSCKVQAMLGANNAGAYDLQAGCTGSLTAMHTAIAGISSGVWNNVLVVGAESFTKWLDWTDRGTCILFGDGAGACVLTVSSDGEGRFVSGKLQADGAKSDMITLESEGEEYPHIFRMKGHDVFKFVSQNLPGFIKSFCDESEILPSEIDFWVLHQANTRIIDGIFKRLGIPSDRTLLNLENYGNTSSASMMIALYEALKGGRIKDKDKVAFVAFGAGMTLGALLYEA